MPTSPLGGFAQKITPGVTPDHLRKCDGPVEPMAALRELRAQSKTVLKSIMGGKELTADDVTAFASAVMLTNSVEGIDHE